MLLAAKDNGALQFTVSAVYGPCTFESTLAEDHGKWCYHCTQLQGERKSNCLLINRYCKGITLNHYVFYPRMK